MLQVVTILRIRIRGTETPQTIEVETTSMSMSQRTSSKPTTIMMVTMVLLIEKMSKTQRFILLNLVLILPMVEIPL